MRKLIAGMINRVPGKYQPVPLVEDVCVNPENLAEYFTGIETIFQKRGIDFLCFGHAGSGTVHIRPFLSLKDQETYTWLPQMCEDVYTLTHKLKGTISGEHGDGLLRAPFIKKQYGELFDVFKQIKHAFDPNGILNPDKKTGCTGFTSWQKDIRFGNSYNPRSLDTKLVWDKDRLLNLVEACNGCGVCRSTIGDKDMCPVFRAFGTEAASTRAKANLMRNFLTGDIDEADMKEIRSFADYCINCKMCSVDCPGGVDASELMLELKAQTTAQGAQSRSAKAICMIEAVLQAASHIPALTNAVSNLSITRKITETLTGISAKRRPPRLSSEPFLINTTAGQTVRGTLSNTGAKHKPRVAYFVDMFANLINPAIANNFISILEHCGVEVVVPEQKGSGILPLNYGEVNKARTIASYNVDKLYPLAQAGYTIVSTEPTAALMLRREYLLLDKGERFKKVADTTMDAVSFLLDLLNKGLIKTGFKNIPLTLGYHTPCHIKTVGTFQAALDLLSPIPGLNIVPINKGCCGIAGTYGMQTKGYDASMRIGAGLFEALSNPEIHAGLTDCSTCRLQMEHGVPQKKTIHPVEVLGAAMGLVHIDTIV